MESNREYLFKYELFDKNFIIFGLKKFQPCMSQNWEMLISFKVHGKGKELFGDGLAFWYARDRMLQGPVFGNNDFFSGMAIILDTYSNHNGPHNVS